MELTPLSLSTQDNTSVNADAELALALSLEDSFPPDDAEVDPLYGLFVPAQTVIVRAYADDSDDRLLAELQPRFIVMYEPNQDFIRRIEVCIMSSLTEGYLIFGCAGIQGVKSWARGSRVFHDLSNDCRRA